MNLDTSLAQLETAQLVRRLLDEDLTYIFKHALVQETAYKSILKNRRRDIHRRIAEVYEQLYADRLNEFATSLSDHCWYGESWEKAAGYAILAGANALRIYALRESAGYYERALAALDHLSTPSPTQIIDALVGWAEAALRIRPFAEQLEQLARAEKIARGLNDKRRLARALYRIGIVHTTWGHGLSAIPPLTECFALASELDDERLTVIPTLFMGIATLNSNPREAINLFERAIELANTYDDLNTLAVAWSTKALAHARVGEFPNAHAALDRAIALVGQLKSPAAESDVYLFSAWTFLDLENWEKGLEFGQLCVNTALAANNLDCMCGGFDCLGFNQLAQQNLPKAVDTFQEAIHRSQFSGAEVYENLGRGGLAMAEYYSGRASALADLEQAYSHAKGMNDGLDGALMAQALGGIYAQRGEAANAEKYLKDAIEYFRPAEMTPYLTRTLESLAQVYTQQGRDAEAEQARAEASQLQYSLLKRKTAREN